MPTSAASFLDESPNPSAASFLDEGPSAASFLDADQKRPEIPQFRAVEEPGLIRRAITSARESLSPLIGPTENQRLRQEQGAAQLAQIAPEIVSHIEDNQTDLMQKEGAIPALFTPSKTQPLQLPQINQQEGVLAQVGAGVYNPLAGAINSAVASPGGMLTLPLSVPLGAVPAIGRIVGGAFAADQARQVIENAPRTIQTILDPNKSTQEKVEAGTGLATTAALGGVGALHALDARLAGKTPEQQSKAIREEIKVTEDKTIADALTDAADTIDREIAARDAAEAQAKEAQQFIERQQKAAQDAQKAQANAAAQASEVPKSTQILQENAKPPAIANVATEAATQTSPFALQGKLNEITAAPAPVVDPALAQIAPEPVPGEISRAPARSNAELGGDIIKFKGALEKPPMAKPDPATVPPFEVPKTAAEIKAADIRKAVRNKNTEYQFTVQQGGDGYPGYVQVDAILPSTPEAQSRNTISSSIKDLNAAGAKLPEVPDWVPTGQYTRAELEALIKKGPLNEPATTTATGPVDRSADLNDRANAETATAEKIGEQANAIPEQSTVESVLGRETSQPQLDVGLRQVGERNAEPQAPAGDVARPQAEEKSQVASEPVANKKIDALNESKLVALADQLGIKTMGMSGERLRSRIISNALPEDIVHAIDNPAPPIPKRGKIKGSKADKWADDILKQGRALSGFDPELLAAHTIKLVGQLETGAVKFADWSAEKIKETGEAIRPYLQQIWDAAHAQIAEKPGERVMAGDNRGTSRSALGKYDYIKTSNADQIAAAKPIIDYVKETGDYEGGFAKLREIQNSADRAVAAASMIESAEAIQDPFVRDRVVARLFREAKGVGTDVAQGLQAQGTVNELIAPYRGHLAWMDIIQSRLKDEVAPKFPQNSAEIINKGMKDAGKEASDVINGKTGATVADANKIAPEVQLPASEVTTELGDAIMARVRQSAGYRDFFTKKGAKGIADQFWQLLAGKRAPEGNIWAFDKIVTSELGQILKEKLEEAGIKEAKGGGIPTAEKIAQFLSDDPLRADKVKLIDEAVRKDIASKPPEEAAHLSALWDSTVAALIDSPASDSMARRILQETLKDQKPKWSEVLKGGAKSISDLKSRVVGAIEAKVKGVQPGGEKLDLASFRNQVGKVFDEIAGERKTAFDKAVAIAEAKRIAANSPEAEASSLLDGFAKLQSDTQAWTDKTIRPVKAALADFLSGKSTAEQFLAKTDALGVKRATSETLLSVAQRQKSVKEAWSQIDKQERLVASLEKSETLLAPIRRIAGSLNIDLRKIFSELPEVQAYRLAEISKRIEADPKFSGLTAVSKEKLIKAMNQAWEQLRNNAFRREFEKVVGLPNIPEPEKVALRKSLPSLIEKSNLGLLDNDAFLDTMGRQYGIEGLDSATGQKLRDLGQKAARTPEGSERNEVYQQIMDAIMEARGVNPWDFLKDYWYRNVMSAPRTAVEIGAGGVIQGTARTFTTAVDTAVRQQRPDLALRMIGMFLKDAATGARLGADLVATGDRAILPRYTEQFLAKMANLEKGKSPGGEIESLYRRSSGLTKAALAPFEYTGRLLTALDYIGGQGVRSQQMLYSALTRGDKASFEAAMRRFNAEEVANAEKQARTELGDKARPAQIIARQREILNHGIDKAIQDFGNTMTEVTALNAPPAGVSGEIYKAVSQIPMMVRAPAGLAFAKAGLNIFQELTNWAPITGQINWARTLWQNPSKNNPFRFLALDKLPPERARQLVVAQATGLAVLAAAANKFLGDKPEDKNGKPREWEISGPWTGLTPTQKSALMSAGERPLSIKLPNGRWLDYKLTPFMSSLATIGHIRDQERFNGKKYSDEDAVNKSVNAWLMGLGSVKDLSLASSFSRLAGFLATDDRELNVDGVTRTLADSVGNAAVGLIPMSSMLRELDNTTDPQRYRSDKKNPGVDLWITQVPFVRRFVNDGKPLLNFLGEPVRVETNPFNRHIGPEPSTAPVEAALSGKVGLGMKLPTLSDNTTIVDKSGKQRPMTGDEIYDYQKSVRQAYARQIAADLPMFQKATPEQASLYSQQVFTAAERYARDRLNTGTPWNGIVPVDPKLTSALSPEYQAVKQMDSNEGSKSALNASRMRINYDELMTSPDRGAALREIATKQPADQTVALIKHATSSATDRTALQRATAGLAAPTRAEFFIGELAKRATPQEKRAYLQQQLAAGLINKEVLRQMRLIGQKN